MRTSRRRVAGSKINVPPAPTVKFVPSAMAVFEVRISVPASTVVPPLYVSVPPRISTPPPISVSARPGLFSPMPPERARLPPAATVASKLSASSNGAVIAWLPLVTVRKAAAPELSSVSAPLVPGESV